MLATITLYYTYYTQTGVTPQILAGLHMSFRYYVGIVVVSNALGAFASLPASKTDKFGRSNVVIYGLLLIGIIIAFWVPNTHSAFSFGAAISAMGIVEGAVLVATPSLVRDYSPQMGRASAMGFWTVGPVAGIVHRLDRRPQHPRRTSTAWQDQFVISGIASLVVFVIALFCLKDLAPKVRDQLDDLRAGQGADPGARLGASARRRSSRASRTPGARSSRGPSSDRPSASRSSCSSTTWPRRSSPSTTSSPSPTRTACPSRPRTPTG